MANMLENLVSGEGSLPGLLDNHLLVVSSHGIFLMSAHGEREREPESEYKTPSVSSYKDINPLGSGPHPYDLF